MQAAISSSAAEGARRNLLFRGTEVLHTAATIYRTHRADPSPTALPEINDEMPRLIGHVDRLRIALDASKDGSEAEELAKQLRASEKVLGKLQDLHRKIIDEPVQVFDSVCRTAKALGHWPPEMVSETQTILDFLGQRYGVTAPRVDDAQAVDRFLGEVREVAGASVDLDREAKLLSQVENARPSELMRLLEASHPERQRDMAEAITGRLLADGDVAAFEQLYTRANAEQKKSLGLCALQWASRLPNQGRALSFLFAEMPLETLHRELSSLDPDGLACIASSIATEAEAALPVLRELGELPPSGAKEMLARTLFLKTSSVTLEASPALIDAHADLLAGTSQKAHLKTILSSESGRKLLSSPAIPAARMWALDKVLEGAPEIQGALCSDSPWQQDGLLELYAKQGVAKFESREHRRQLIAARDADLLVGASLGAPLRDDYEPEQHRTDPSYNLFEGHPAVEKAADGIRTAMGLVGGREAAVETIPVQFSSQETGPVELKVYRVEGENGERYVDNTGGVYESFQDYLDDNELPPGKLTFPVGGHVGPPGQTKLHTIETESFGEKVRGVVDTVALVGGIAASGVIIAGSFGTATPLVGGAWAVAIGTAGWAAAASTYDLAHRADHHRSLSLSDPDARAAWLSLAGAGLTVAGAGAMRGATVLANTGSRLAPQAARAAGTINASANFADAAATVDQAHVLATGWDQMTSAQRMQVGLSIAFWGGMTGVSSKASGGKLSDAFSFRAQINSALIESGAAVQTNPVMSGGHARIRTGYGEGRLNLSVEFGPGTSPPSIRIHREVARSLIDNSGVQGAIRRSLLDASFRPGSRGEEVALEVVKHRALVKAFDAEMLRAPEAERSALRMERDGYAAALRSHEAELARMKADSSAARRDGVGHVDAVSSRTISRLQGYVAEAKTRASSPEAQVRLDVLSARLEKVAANLEKGKVPKDRNSVKALLYMVAEIDRLSPPPASAPRATVKVKTPSFDSLTTNPKMAREAAAMYPDIYKRLRAVSDRLFSGKKARAQVHPLVEKMAVAESLHQAREGRPLGLEPGAPARTAIDPSKDFPMGFKSREDFDAFRSDLEPSIRAVDPNARLVLQGSSLGGRRFERTVDFDSTGEPFDVGRISDYDIAIESDALARKMQASDITTTDRSLYFDELDELGLGELYRAAQESALRRTGIAHTVNFKIFPAGGVPEKGPSLPVVE